MSLVESKHRMMASRDVKKRFSSHHRNTKSLDASSGGSAENNKEEENSPAAPSAAATRGSGKSEPNSSACVVGAAGGNSNKKRVMTMSELRNAASRGASAAMSPLRQLAVAKSPLAQRIRSSILSSGSTPAHKADAFYTPFPLTSGGGTIGMSSPRPTPPSSSSSSSSRRQRLHETRFRRHSVGSASAGAKTTSEALLRLMCPNTPLARYSKWPTGSIFSPPMATTTTTSARRTLLATSEQRKSTKKPAPVPKATSDPSVGDTRGDSRNDKPSVASGDTATTTKPPPRSSSSRTPAVSKPRRMISSRSPLQALMGTSNGSQQSSSSTHALEATTKVPPDNDANATTRCNLDKRTARLWHGKTFAREIARLVVAQAAAPLVEAKPTSSSVLGSHVTVAIRKRPLFPRDASRGDFDVVAMGHNSCTVYKTTFKSDMNTAMVAPITYPCSMTFDEASTNRQVYNGVLKPLVAVATQYRAKAGTRPPSAALLHFGQTGSGKSYTMAGLQRELADDLSYPVAVQCMEVSGKSCRDLLVRQSENSSRSSSTVRVLNSVIVGAKWVSVGNPDELLQVLAVAKSHRATHTTDRNHESSRSHAVVTLRLEATGASLTLVDCAGTECSYDSLFHSKDRLFESGDINLSLYALKQCIRARAAATSSSSHAKAVVAPYRSSTLTCILRPHFERGGPLAVVATVSPNATDTEQTLGTLDTVTTLLGTTRREGSPKAVARESRPRPPKAWNHEELVRFLDSKHLLKSSKRSPGSNSTFAPVVVPSTMDGRQLMRMNKIQITNALRTSNASAGKVFDLLRAETTRVARLELKQRVAWTRGLHADGPAT